MAQVLIRNLDPATVERLKERARQHGRSLQAEAKAILVQGAGLYTMEEARAASEAWHRRLGGRKFSDSAAMVRKDRRR
jgi:plasmid stability protein